MNKEIKVFKNEEFGEVRTLLIDNEVWFVGKDVAKSLGYKDTKDAISKHVDLEDKTIIQRSQIDTLEIPNRGLTIINESGVISFIVHSKTRSSEYKDRFKNWLILEGLIENKFCITSRKEINFLDMLEKTLEPFGYKTIRQYRVLGYKIDLYIEDLNIAVEYDENNHKYYSYKEQEGRQILIEKELGCKFIRVSDKESDLYNIGLVMKGMVA